MSYTPTEWVSGDVITAAKMNKLENGVANAGGGGGGVLKVTSSGGTLDKTWAEIYAAGFSVMHDEVGGYIQLDAVEDEGDYLVAYWAFGLSEPKIFIASSENGYPEVDI